MAADEKELSFFDSTYKALVTFLDGIDKGESIPRKKLRNRLINIGLRDFLEIVSDETGQEKLALQELGFPFKFVEQLDEAILALAHYLIRFKEEGGSLKVYALNRLSKGEDKNLSYWQSEKARLYIEIQNLIMLLNDIQDSPSEPKRHSEILRIFTFRDIDDIAFLTQDAINAMSEQLGAKIKIGFLFLNSIDKIESINLLSNTLVIDFRPNRIETLSPHKFNFYALYRVLDGAAPHALPYKDRCKTKWYIDLDDAISSDLRLGSILELFDKREWEDLAAKNQHRICKYETMGNEFFNNTTLMMYKAFQGSSVKQSYGVGGDRDSDEAFVDRLNQTVVTDDLIRLERAMSAFGESKRITAVDATSVKDSLKIHESTPIYRHWIRNTLNRVLSSDNKELERTYILRDTKKDANVEFQSFKKQMQYYFDYLHYDISEVTDIVHAHDPNELKNSTVSLQNQPWFKGKWQSLRDGKRLRIHVTTARILQEFAPRTMNPETHPRMFAEIFSKPPTDFEVAYQDLSNLDYLSTEKMIYNFKNELADPSELKFEAFLYRSNQSFNLQNEKKILFDFADKYPKLKALQTQHRLRSLAKSIVDYNSEYDEILAEQYVQHQGVIEKVTEILENGKPFSTEYILKILKVRQAFEERLYSYFQPRLSHLYDLLEFQSVEIDFFQDSNARLIEEVSPFVNCPDVDKLRDHIRECTNNNFKIKTLPRFTDEGPKKKESPVQIRTKKT
jgi:hypothetical protein